MSNPSASFIVPPHGRSHLRELLSARIRTPENTAAIDAEIKHLFERRVAILALDMCGFTRLTAEHGVIHFLEMIHRMEEGAAPAVTGNGGTVIKHEADNLFAIFDEPAAALEAALDVFRIFEGMNAVSPPDRHIHGSIGIGFGETLIIGDEDVFGCEMNFACKLGEDLAERNEILLTPAAHRNLNRELYECREETFRIGNAEKQAYRYVGKLSNSDLPDALAS